MNLQSNQTDDTEIDLKELFLVAWNAKLLIFLVTIVSLLYGIYNLRQTVDKYSVNIVYKQVGEDEGKKSLIDSRLASLSGLNPLLSSSSDFDTFMYLMRSEEVAKSIFQNSELIKKIFASEYNDQSNSFKMQPIGSLGLLFRNIKSYITGRDIEPYQPPDPRRLAIILQKSFNASVDKKTGFLTVSAEANKPYIALELMESAILTADMLIKDRYIENFSKSLNFYQSKIVQAKSSEHREALAMLIVDGEKKLMLASIGDNFVVEPISQPEISFYPTSPKPIRILIFSIFIGILSGSALAIVINYFKKR